MFFPPTARTDHVKHHQPGREKVSHSEPLPDAPLKELDLIKKDLGFTLIL